MRGGRRTGAGRKQGFAAKNAEEARRLLSERVAKEIGPLSDVLISQAKRGDIRAIKELFDRAWGRAPQAIAIQDDSKLPVPIMGLRLADVSPEALSRYALSGEERAVLEKRLIPKTKDLQKSQTRATMTS